MINDKGKPLSERQYIRRWNKIAAIINPNQRVTAHQFRHFFSSICAASNEISTKTLQTIMGHADISTTMNIYANARTEELAKAGQIVGQAYTKIASKSAEFTAQYK